MPAKAVKQKKKGWSDPPILKSADPTPHPETPIEDLHRPVPHQVTNTRRTAPDTPAPDVHG